MKTILFFILFLLFSLTASSQNISSEKEEIERIKKQIGLAIHASPDSATIYIHRGMQLSLQLEDSASLGYFHIQKGLFYITLSERNKAVNSFFTARKIYEKIGDIQGMANAHANLGLYSNASSEEKLFHLNKSESLYKSINDLFGLSRSYNNMAVFYDELGENDSALYYYQKSYKIVEDLKNHSAMNMVLFNMVGTYSSMGEYARAFEIHYKQKANLGKAGNYITAGYYHNQANLYRNMEMYDSALYYIESNIELFRPYPNILRNSYDMLSEIYDDGKHNYKKALLYQRKSDSLNKIILTNNNSNLLSMLEAQHETEIKEERIKKLHVEKEKAEESRLFLLVLLISFSIFTVLLFWQIRQKAQKKKEKIELEQKLMAAELHNSEMKRQYLNGELKYANKELTIFAANIVQNKEILTDLKKHVHTLSREKDTGAIKDHLQDMNIKLLQHLYSDDQREQFVKRASELNRSLIYNIKNKFPDITDKDLNLLILILIKFDYKEIASIYNISFRSVIQRRYRLRKKLKLQKNQTFEDFFDKFIPELEQA